MFLDFSYDNKGNMGYISKAPSQNVSGKYFRKILEKAEPHY